MRTASAPAPAAEWHLRREIVDCRVEARVPVAQRIIGEKASPEVTGDEVSHVTTDHVGHGPETLHR